MKAKGLGVLAVVTLAALAGATAVLRTNPTTVVSDKRGQVVFPSLATKGAEITSIEIKDGDRSIVVERKDNGFVAAGSGYPVKLDAVRDLVIGAAGLKFEESKTSDPARYSDLGLKVTGQSYDSGKEVTLKAGGSTLASFTVGNRDASVGGPQGGTYIRIGEEAQTWLARGEVKLPGMKQDWFDNNLVKIDHDKVAKVEISGGDKETLVVSSPEAGKELERASVPEGRTANPGSVSRMSGLVESLDFMDVRKASADKAGDRKYVAETRDGLVLTIVQIGNVADNWVRITASSKAEASATQAKEIAAKVDGRDFQMPGYQNDMFGWTMNDVSSDQKS